MKLFAISTIVLLVFLNCNVYGQENLDKYELDSIDSKFDELFSERRTYLLLQIQALPFQHIGQKNEVDVIQFYRPKITNLYIRYADHLLESGLDLDFDYASINCYRWNVMTMADTSTYEGIEELRNVEIARKNNEYFCEKLSLYREYQDFCSAFHTFYKYNWSGHNVKFSDLKDLVSEFYDGKSKNNMDKVLRMLKRSKTRKKCH